MWRCLGLSESFFSDRVNFLSAQGPKVMVWDVEKTGVKYLYLSVSVRKSMN